MAVKLNRTAYAYAQELVRAGKVVADDRDAWSEHQPSTAEENEFVRQHGFAEYARWHLGVDDSEPSDTKRRHLSIQEACAHLHGMIEAIRGDVTPAHAP